MIEKVNPSHPDKVADRIAGALVDLAYKKQENPRIAVEVLIGHGTCHIIAETSVKLPVDEVELTAARIAGMGHADIATGRIDYVEVPQDEHLAENQSKEIRCGDNGIFKGVPMNEEETTLLQVTQELYKEYPTDGKFIYDQEGRCFIACQSCAASKDIAESIDKKLQIRDIDDTNIVVNPLGDWTGGTDVDTGATNRKLGSDMGRAVTGGGLHGKDLSKADVSVNIACHILAQKNQEPIEAMCAIGDDRIGFSTAKDCLMIKYSEVVDMAREYIERLGGFEALAEWGLR